MSRPTIADVAKAAEVSISTVDRVLTGRKTVKRATAERVLAAAQEIGFYAAGVIRHNLEARPTYTLGFLLQQSSRSFYRSLAQQLTEASQTYPQANIQARIEFMDDLAPHAVAEHMLKLGKKVQALSVVAAEHARIAQAIESLAADNVPTFSLISTLTAPCGVGYIGLDNWKVGRTAAWALHHFCPQGGKVAIMVGSHRYRCQELNESGFRSYFREHANHFQLLEPMISGEERAVAAELTRNLLLREPDLKGLYIAGGGVSGVVEVLREQQRPQLFTIGHDLMDVTQNALVDGVLSLVLSHPLPRLAEVAVQAMVSSISDSHAKALPTKLLAFDLYTAENV